MDIDLTLTPLQPNTIQLYIYGTAHINAPIRLEFGWIDEDGELTDVTGLVSVEVVSSNATLMGNRIIVNSVAEETIYLRVLYESHIQYFSFLAVKPIPSISNESITAAYKRFLPLGVYTDYTESYSGMDDKANCAVLSEVYASQSVTTVASDTETLIALYGDEELNISFSVDDNLQNAIVRTDRSSTTVPMVINPAFTTMEKVSNLIFPDSGDPRWEIDTRGTNSIYLQPSTDYSSLMVLFYQIMTNNSNNPYWLAFNLSKYIYLRLGIKKYVYVADISSSIMNSFIISASELSECMLGGEDTKVINIYVLKDGDTLDAKFQREFIEFCQIAIRPTFIINVDFTKTAGNLGMYDIGNTYLGDPRQLNVECIQYNEEILSEAKGMSSYNSVIDLLDFETVLTPPPFDNMLIEGIDYLVTISTTPYTPTESRYDLLGMYVSRNPEIGQYSKVGNNQYLKALSLGNLNVKNYLLFLNKEYDYEVIPSIADYLFILNQNYSGYMYMDDLDERAISNFSVLLNGLVITELIIGTTYDVTYTKNPDTYSGESIDLYCNSDKITIAKVGNTQQITANLSGSITINYYLLNRHYAISYNIS